MYKLVIANRNYSSWSLRAWLFLTESKIQFEEIRLSDACRTQIARIDHIWADCRSNYGDAGEWLFGEFSIADIVYMPVALRFVTYSIPVSDLARQFVSAVQLSDSVQQWIKAAHAERESLSFIDELTPAATSPITPG